MEDRIPTPGQEGRMLIEPENGSAPFYAKLTMADNPTNLGTPLNKETLLQDNTEISLFGSSANRTVDEAFSGIASVLKLVMSDVASITLTVKDQAGNAVKNVLVNGIISEEGQAVYTNTSGIASGYVSEGPVNLSISGYADIEDYSETFTAVKGSSYTKSWTVNRINFVSITSSKSTKFSGNVTNIDYTIVGGGQAGGNGWNDGGSQPPSAGCGGYGGEVIVQEGVPVTANTSYAAVIGSGGRGVQSYAQPWIGKPGGSSSFMGQTAAGGSGQNTRRTTAGSGPAGNVGTAGYTSYTETTRFGGDGGGGGYTQDDYDEDIPGPGGAGGADTGADGGTGSDWGGNGASASPNTGGGGGGGGYYIYRGDDYHAGKGGRGGSGIVTFRIHFDFGELAA